MDLGQPEQLVLDANAIAKDANSKFFQLASHAVRRACAESQSRITYMSLKPRSQTPAVARKRDPLNICRGPIMGLERLQRPDQEAASQECLGPRDI